MNFNEYQQAALRTWSDHDGDHNARLTNAIFGIAGESGEVVDLMKKIAYHGRPWDSAAIVNELGDLLYYVAVFAEECGLSLSDVAANNIAKLEKRYPNGYSHEDSAKRKDVQR